MTPGSKKESLLGILLTAVLCGGFLYWWFQPRPPVWQHETAAQLVERAAKEPAPSDAAQRLVLDFDFMEVAVMQARAGLIDDAQKTAAHISEPAIQAEAARVTAHAFLNSDPTDLGRALRLADALKNDGDRAAVRSTIVTTLAVLGYPDAAIPEAKTPLQKAALARRLASTDLQPKARELIAAAEAALPSLDAAAAQSVREELAWAYSGLTLADGPQKAIDAIKALPAPQQPPLWDDLAGWCAGRDDRDAILRAVLSAVPDPAVRLKLETDSLLTEAKLRPAAELETEARAAIAAAADPAAKLTALLSLAKIQRNAALPDAVKAEAAAAETVKLARSAAAEIKDPAARAAALAEITRRFADLNLLTAAVEALKEATAAARTITEPAARVPVLIDLSAEWLNQARAADSDALIAEAAALAESGPADPAALRTAATALVKKGDWPRAAALLIRITDPPARRAALSAAADEASESALSADPAEPPARGEPVDGIRRAAAGDEFKAAALVEAQPAGFAKARAWLAMAKGVQTPPASLNDYIATGAQPADAPPPPEDGKDAKPGE